MKKKPELSDHLKGEFTAQGSEGSWVGQEIEFKSGPIEDTGTGQPIILRTFEFSIPPGVPKNLLPSKKQLLDFHRSKVIAFLWKDELELVMEPKIVLSKKSLKFRIFATCQAKKGSLINQRPQLLQNATKVHTG